MLSFFNCCIKIEKVNGKNSKNLRLNGHASFEFQTRNYITFHVYVFLCMVADVTETRNVIPSLEFKTYMTIKS